MEISGGLDIREYVTPDFDESYNTNLYAPWRHRRVAPVLAKDYRDFDKRPNIQRRFERYRTGWSPSLSKELIDAHFKALGTDPHHACWAEGVCNVRS